MNDIRPFRGLRFDETITGPLGSVVCPPYDVISSVEQVELYGRSPYNVVRLELGLEYPEDGAEINRYTRAADTMAGWLAEGALKAEEEPAVYLYEQQFPFNGGTLARRGLLARLRLTPWEAGVVLPHEETMAGPKQDRLRLMRTTACNLSPLFLLFDDRSGTVGELMEQTATAAQPSAQAYTGDGDLHRMWVVQGDMLRLMMGALAEPQLYMADGHHRYETALAYRDQMAAADPMGSADAAYNFEMVLLVDSRDPGLVVLPIHRLVRGIGVDRLAALDAALAQLFDVEMVEASQDAAGTAEAMTRRMREMASERPVLGYYGSGTAGPVVLRPSAQPKASELDRPLLDVDMLQESVLDLLLGISAEALSAGSSLGYTRDAVEAIESVKRGTAQAAFLLNPTRVDQVLETARAGGRMPQKSTYFYPKPETGLVINPLK